MNTVEVDYLVVGAGGMGMAFADTIITQTGATVAIVDRYHQPGGHWTTAYPFVRLHQPSAFYGVNSRHLGSDTIDQVGWNAGLYELATAGEVCAYFDQVMQQRFLPSGRVSYFPMSEYLGDARFRTLGGQEYTVAVRRRVVDSTYMHVEVPSMRPAPYPVADGVVCVPPNDLPRYSRGRECYVIVGAGKTGIDAALWLLRQGISPDNLTWIMPRDSWLVDRAYAQPGALFAEETMAALNAQAAAIGAATSIDDLFDRFEATGIVMRVDPSVRPTMYRCATVSKAELDQLRRITDIVRMGRLQRIETDRLILDDGERKADSSALYIDCTADGLERRPAIPVFEPGRITLQTVRACQQVFSAAVIAYVETAYDDDAVKNDLCVPVPHPDAAADWLTTTIGYNNNHMRWLDEPALMDWLRAGRLDMFGYLNPEPPVDVAAREMLVGQLKSTMKTTNDQLEALLQRAATPVNA